MKKIASLIFLVLIWISCDTGVPPPPNPPGAKIQKSDFSRVNIQLTDYDQVKVTHQLGIDLYSPELIAVSVGVKDSTSYSELARATSFFDSQEGVYRVQFTFSVNMDSSLIFTPLTIRYHLADSTLIDVDTAVALFTYPYSSAQILFTRHEVQTGGVFQDFDRIGDKVFLHSTGPTGLHEYDLSTHQLRQLFLYPGGDHVAADSIFVFCEAGRFFFRFNILLDSVDIMTELFPNRISGLEAYDHVLYALAGSPPYSLRRYTYDGVLVDSIVFSESVYYLTIETNIAYMSSSPHLIKRFDLNTKTFLTDIKAPAYNQMGIKIYQGAFYYADYWKRYIGYFPVSDLKN